MHTELIGGIYHRLSARRDAIIRYYVKNRVLKANDSVSYDRYRKELRDINKRLRAIRQCIPANPALGSESGA